MSSTSFGRFVAVGCAGSFACGLPLAVWMEAASIDPAVQFFLTMVAGGSGAVILLAICLRLGWLR